jgi:hypothetical protein
LIEVKFGLGGGIEKIAEQVEGYYEALKQNIRQIAKDTQSLLRQKMEMGLIIGGEKNAHEKLKRLDVSDDPKKIKIVLALVEVNPRSALLDREGPKLTQLEAKWELEAGIDIYHFGYGLWKENADPVKGRAAIA